MSVKVLLPSALRHFADGRDMLELEGDRVGKVLQALVAACPRLRPHLFGDDGRLRNFVNLYVNEDDIRDREQNDTALCDGDELTIVPAIAGG